MKIKNNKHLQVLVAICMLSFVMSCTASGIPDFPTCDQGQVLIGEFEEAGGGGIPATGDIGYNIAGTGMYLTVGTAGVPIDTTILSFITPVTQGDYTIKASFLSEHSAYTSMEIFSDAKSLKALGFSPFIIRVAPYAGDSDSDKFRDEAASAFKTIDGVELKAIKDYMQNDVKIKAGDPMPSDYRFAQNDKGEYLFATVTTEEDDLPEVNTGFYFTVGMHTLRITATDTASQEVGICEISATVLPMPSTN